jgi:hypothetical protein
MGLDRGYWKTDGPLQRDSSAPDWTPAKPYQVDSLDEATLVGSKLPSGKHAPVIDIDLPCELVPSSTPGHFHLYIEKAITWPRYEALLKALVDAGIVEEGYYKASVVHMQTFVRKPGLTKAHS